MQQNTQARLDLARPAADGLFLPDLLRIGVPIALQNLVSASVNMLGTVMVGQLGSAALAAVGLGNQIYFLLLIFLFGVSTGGGVFTAQYWGKRDIAGIRRTLGLSYLVGMAVALAFTIAALAFPAGLIGLYSRDPEVISIGAGYLRVVALSYPPMAMSFVLGLAMRSVEKVRLPLVATTLSLALSLSLSWLLIFGGLGIPAMGVVGAAWATVAARVVEALILFIVSYARRYPTAARLRELVDWGGAWVARFWIIALPVMLNEVTWSLGITTYNAIFARAGTGAVAAYSVITTVGNLAMVVFFGTANAAAVMIGKKIGEGRLEAAFTYARRFAIMAPLIGVAVGAVLVPLRLLLPLVFRLEEAVLAQASIMLLVLAATVPFKAFNLHLVVGICRSGGDTRFGMLYDLGGVWGLGVPLAALGAFVWGLPAWGIFLMTSSDEVGKSLFGVWRLMSRKWIHDVTVH
ncbi:MAG TPA: MATE family efflux transporter [Rectinemataceae bacterium]|nr:MATE family efflux transporter [Rectinemataceae bacterium]